MMVDDFLTNPTATQPVSQEDIEDIEKSNIEEQSEDYQSLLVEWDITLSDGLSDDE